MTKKSNDEVRNTKVVEELLDSTKRKILVTKSAGCVHQRNKCMQDALHRSEPAGEELGWVEERGGEGREKRWN